MIPNIFKEGAKISYNCHTLSSTKQILKEMKESSGCDLINERHKDLNQICNGSAVGGVSTGHRIWLILFELTLL